MNRYMVFNIGCIECGVSSGIVGFYESVEEANAVAKKLDDVMDWREGGQNSYEVFDTHGPFDPAYMEAINGK